MWQQVFRQISTTCWPTTLHVIRTNTNRTKPGLIAMTTKQRRLPKVHKHCQRGCWEDLPITKETVQAIVTLVIIHGRPTTLSQGRQPAYGCMLTTLTVQFLRSFYFFPTKDWSLKWKQLLSRLRRRRFWESPFGKGKIPSFSRQHVTALTIVLIDDPQALFDSMLLWTRLVDIFLSRRSGNQTQHKRSNGLAILRTKRESGHSQTLVISLVSSLVIIITARLSQFLIEETRAIM